MAFFYHVSPSLERDQGGWLRCIDKIINPTMDNAEYLLLVEKII